MSHENEEHHDVHSVGHYRRIYVILLIMLVVSVVGPEVAKHVDNAAIARAIVLFTAFGIAIYKAYLVCKNFMHLNVQRRYVLYMLGTMLAFVFMFFSAVAPDVMKHEGQNWENVKAKEAVQRGMEIGEVYGEGADHGEHAGEHGGGH